MTALSMPQDGNLNCGIPDAPHASRRVLVVASEPVLAFTRAALVRTAGFSCKTTPGATSAILLLQNETFDLILLGHELDPREMLEQWLHQMFPGLLILKIENREWMVNAYASRTIDGHPANVIAALREMLGDIGPAPLH